MRARWSTWRIVRWINAHPLARLPALPIIRCVEHQHVNPTATLGKVREGGHVPDLFCAAAHFFFAGSVLVFLPRLVPLLPLTGHYLQQAQLVRHIV